MTQTAVNSLPIEEILNVAFWVKYHFKHFSDYECTAWRRLTYLFLLATLLPFYLKVANCMKTLYAYEDSGM